MNPLGPQQPVVFCSRCGAQTSLPCTSVPEELGMQVAAWCSRRELPRCAVGAKHVGLRGARVLSETQQTG